MEKEPITREKAMAVLYKLYNRPYIPGILGQCNDVQAASTAVAWIASETVTSADVDDIIDGSQVGLDDQIPEKG
jgi:hypothetical protein